MRKSQDELLSEVERRIALMSAWEAEWEAGRSGEGGRAAQAKVPLAQELNRLQGFLDAVFPGEAARQGSAQEEGREES